MIRITVGRNDFAKIAAMLPQRGAEVVATTSLEVQDGAERRSRVDTGTMRRGWHVEFEDPTHATIGNPVPYTEFNEFGTAHMAAQPMLIPEIEIARPKFAARVRGILKP